MCKNLKQQIKKNGYSTLMSTDLSSYKIFPELNLKFDCKKIIIIKKISCHLYDPQSLRWRLISEIMDKNQPPRATLARFKNARLVFYVGVGPRKSIHNVAWQFLSYFRVCAWKRPVLSYFCWVFHQWLTFNIISIRLCLYGSLIQGWESESWFG